jgi:hypothetical protein
MPPGVPPPDDRALGMRATKDTRVAGNEVSDAPIIAQFTQFNPRYRFNHSTVVQAVENTRIWKSNPIGTGPNHRSQDTETSNCAEVGR